MFTIDSVTYNKAARIPYDPKKACGYQPRSLALSSYRSLLIHTTNGVKGSSFEAEANYIANSRVISAHYLIGKHGQIVQFLHPSRYIAYHAGCVKATRYSNLYAIGIEMHNTPLEGHISTQQFTALDWLTRKLVAQYVLDVRYVDTHRAVAVYCPGHPNAGQLGRKIDPSGFPDAEFYTWRDTLATPVTHAEYQVINSRGVNIRQAPNINAKIAGTLSYLAVFVSDGLNNDENGMYLQGTNKWAHMESGLGFVHVSNLKMI